MRHPDVEKQCVICGTKFIVSFYKRNRKTCSRKCSGQLRLRHLDRESFGQAVSKAKKGKTHRGAPWSQETREHLLAVFNDGRRRGTGNSMFGRRHTDDARARMSATRTQRIIDGVYDTRKWAKKGNVWASKAQRNIPYRSSWELRAIERLERDPTVTSFKFEPVRIPYFYQAQNDEISRQRHYVPDFLIDYTDGSRLLVEVKPDCHVSAAINVAKAAAARELCEEMGWQFKFWTKEDLF